MAARNVRGPFDRVVFALYSVRIEPKHGDHRMSRFPRQSALSLPSDRLARMQLWSELPTLVGVVAVVLGALFL